MNPGKTNRTELNGMEAAESGIAKLFSTRGLGEVLLPVTPVSGGLMHRMFRVNTPGRSYAVKHLNPGIMKRPEAMDNYRRAESLEGILEEAGIPIVPALAFNGRKMQELDGEFYYIFPWQNGRITDGYGITAEQCRLAGNIQGRIHALRPKRINRPEPILSRIDWQGYAGEADRLQNAAAPLLKENLGLLDYAQDAVNRARQALPGIECITDEDMDPKNVMWDNGKPVVIDLECLDYGNPVSHALQLSLQWSGITICGLKPGLQRAFFEGYLDAYDNGFRDYGSVLGLAYTWIEWLEYNITRALGGPDEGERETGAAEVRNTIRRLRYLRENEGLVRRNLARIFGPG